MYHTIHRLNGTTQRFSVYSQNCATITTTLEHFHNSKKKPHTDSLPISPKFQPHPVALSKH